MSGHTRMSVRKVKPSTSWPRSGPPRREVCWGSRVLACIAYTKNKDGWYWYGDAGPNTLLTVGAKPFEECLADAKKAAKELLAREQAEAQP